MKLSPSSLKTCSRCKDAPAVVIREHSGEAVCKGCFKKEIERRVRRTVKRFNMLTSQDKVAMAVSGGKDSIMLLAVLEKLYHNLFEHHDRQGRPPIIITIDEGIQHYRDESLTMARKACERAGFEHVVFSFEKDFGINLDGMIKKASELLEKESHRKYLKDTMLKNAEKLIYKPCSICGVLRRKLLDDIAQSMGATVLATGHNLNDEVETFLMNMMRGDTKRIQRASAVRSGRGSPFIRKVKPLQDIMQRDIVLYLYHTGEEFQAISCPYSRNTSIMRGEMNDIIARLENAHPGTSFNLKKCMAFVYDSIDKGYDAGISRVSIESTCPGCTGPKSIGTSICMACYYCKVLAGQDYARMLRSFVSRIQ
ncbi:hypothetical protein GF325_01125 [Candidatus Bathyarchaeota archaeon]|nr:hypothetical protein [Candidatus Bathyarchaeota archaeon]